MPPAKKVGAGAATAPASSQQRSIASFFESGSKANTASKPTASAKNTKPSLNIPSVNESSPAVKRARNGSQSKSPPPADGNSESKLEVPVSPEMNGSKKASPSKKKVTDGVQTPSPTEAPCPAKSVTKFFGRRGKNATKAEGTADLPALESAKAGNGRGSPNRGDSVVGMRLRVWWPLDRVWYPGRVKAFNTENGTHVIAYDDGEDEIVTLSKEKLDWLDENEALEGLQKLAGARTKRRGLKADEDLPANGKRKKSSSEERTLDSPRMQQPEEDGGSPDKLARRNKRARTTADADSPVKLTVTADLFDEVDMAMPKEEEVKVRRRLKKKVSPTELEPKVEEVEMLDVEDLEVATTLAEHKLKESMVVGKRPGTSARRLQLEQLAALQHSSSEEEQEEEEDSPLNETLADLASKKIPSKTEKSLVSQKTAKEFFSEKLSGARAQKCSADTHPGRLKPVSEVKQDSAEKKVKSAPIDKQTLREALSGGLKGVTSLEKAEVCKSPQEIEAQRLARGELHAALVGEPAARFLGRVEEKFKFLGRNRKDASGRRPSDPNYDPRTVYLPQDFTKELSGGQLQWWEFKSKHMDKVLLFKVGKFYEMFEMDAHIGAQELDLQYMKGDQPHCGFPEKNYAVNAEKLAQKGYRVLIVEQTETPEQLEQRKRKTGSKDKVVRREVCAVITKGTLVDGDMLVARPDAAYLLSITERDFPFKEVSENGLPIARSKSEAQACIIGMCTVDTSTSHIMLGQFCDDMARTRLRGLLAEIRPVEVIKPHGLLTDATERALKDHTRQPLVTSLAPGKEFWDAKRSIREIMTIFASFKPAERASQNLQENGMAESEAVTENNCLPEALQRLVEADELGELALSSLGGALFYLQQALLDQTVLRLGRVDLLPGTDSFNMTKPSATCEGLIESNGGLSPIKRSEGIAGSDLEPYLLMDATALENLEIIENNRDGGTRGTLLGHLDYCVTPYGRRLLKQWLVRPLMRVDSIVKRQEAIHDLKTVASEAATSFRKELRSQPDMERFLSRLHAYSDESGRNAQKVVLYEDAAKKLLQELLATLRGCQALLQAVKSFEVVLPELSSDRLKQLISPDGGLSEMFSIIENFETAFDWDEAETTGRIVPSVEGVDAEFDEADSTVKSVSEKLSDYLSKQRKKFGNSSEINYVTVGKEAYQMEVPEELHAKVPASYEVRSSRKGYRRYWTPEIKELLQDLTAGEQQREQALQGILKGLVKRFCGHYQKWLFLIKSVAELDVLISLAEASEYAAPTCRPSFVSADPNSSASYQTPMISARSLRHPTLRLNGGGTVVPNDIELGGSHTSFMLLTGPNMGGKSTLIRQVCLAVILAQIGANVPAEQFEMSPVDKLFVRMGARDHIMAGQSTFLVEMSETAAMLRGATSNSLVALDELGRGTSTADGQAIAHAVMERLVSDVGCRGMFSTHYHRLSTHYSVTDSKVGLYHMSCTVGTEAGGLEEVTFLYKLAPGPCPKSYGVNVARLAGIPEPVLERAAARSAELESSWAEKDGSRTEDKLDVEVQGSTPSDSKFPTEVLAFIKKLLDDLDKGGNPDEFMSSQEAVHLLLKLNNKELL
ncbi:DNA mismatch repair protein MSH6 [Marchantia polymorpha subsp. ruderalis]|uniref:DNA mismatch repair protein n=1 Tax=Marchantia polymorpha TaxID=3197 RepID=A0A2R6X1U9_MARPO|nr:hypothetical protein MARPO_0042s0086 [Marchantia polymorpha]BBN02356.1 hypothetical protein Mp_2g14640 [Marchantia polymorpha subsp. ruderalis]|eukprot:PTQ40051.1 hypothetical protein MARPO_0042s0086 [Marchantia polymorpha]